jgi:hypothetical protein
MKIWKAWMTFVAWLTFLEFVFLALFFLTLLGAALWGLVLRQP